MKYSETGKFTPEMEKLAKEIKSKIAKLRKLGCVVIGQQYELNAYMAEDYSHSQDNISGYSLKSLVCGKINDSGADDELYFEPGYINED